MSFCITLVQDDACFRGAVKSILEDAGIDQNKKEEIIKIIDDHTQGTVTSIFPCSSNPDEDFNKLFKNYLKAISPKTNIPSSQIETELQMVNLNTNTFCLLFWEGNAKGENRHVTRYCELQGDKVLLMDPTKGEICYFFLEELSSLSPNGFSIIVFSFV